MPEGVIEFSVSGQPVQWAVHQRQDNNPRSPRFEKKQRLVVYQDSVRIAARAAMRGLPPHDGLVHLDVWFYLGIPVSAGKTQAARARWVTKHRLIGGKFNPDRTNLLKGFEDALNGIVFLDDVLVVNGATVKEFAGVPETVAVVRFM